MKVHLLFLASTGWAFGQGSNSENYTILPASIDGGGGAASSQNHTITASRIGGFIGTSSSANYESQAGYVPQTLHNFLVDLCDFTSWAGQYFTNGQAKSGENEDFDGDGQSNGEEFLALTDPTNPQSQFRFNIVWLGSQYNLVFSPAAPENPRNYSLLVDDDLEGEFQTLLGQPQFSNGEGIFTFNLGANEPRRFFKVKITKDP